MHHPVRAVVAFAGSRDGYQLPLALSEADLLEAFVTDIYFPAEKRWFGLSVGKVLPPSFVNARYKPGLDSIRVRTVPSASLAASINTLRRGTIPSRIIDKRLGRKAKLLSVQHNAAAFCCSYYAYHAFKVQGRRPKFRFIFQLHPHPVVVRELLEEEVKLNPSAKHSLLSEPDLSLPEREFEELSTEPHLANGWVVASSYTARTLAQQGIPLEHIQVVPYGVDSATFTYRSKPPASNRPFTIIFVGSLTQRKGLSYLLDAVRMLRSSNVKVLLCGRGRVDYPLLEKYKDLSIEIKLGLPTAQLVTHLHQADIFVLPSLVEGFAHVVLEAMASGLPIITTTNTCGPDVMSEGHHGFLLPIRNSEMIADRLAWGAENRNLLFEMGHEASEQARLFTWERFRSNLRNAYHRMISDVQ